MMLKPQKIRTILTLVIILALSCSCVHLLSLKRNRGGTTSRSIIIIGPELTTLSSNLSLIWSSTQDKTLRKFNLPNCYRYGLCFQFVKNTSHLVMSLANGTANTIINDTFWSYGTLTKTLPHWGGGIFVDSKQSVLIK